MHSRDKILVVIPVYKEELDNSEIISLCRAIEVLPQYVFSLVCPKGLRIEKYLAYFNSAGTQVLVERFQDDYFQSISGYNRLMLSPNFYKRFRSWNYVLIYQLDCFIFKDETDFWVNKNFDYIGAPWFSNDRMVSFYQSLNYSKWGVLGFFKKSVDFNKGYKVHVGNGGFSLRKVKRFIMVSKILNLLFKRHLRGHINEDFIWSILVTKYFLNFKIPSPLIASKFALEEITSLVDMNQMESLPMGSHAWKKCYPELWNTLVLKFQR